MNNRFIVLLATLDTKAGEAAYLQAAIEARGWPTRIVDVGLREAVPGLAGVTNEEVAHANDTSLSQLHAFPRRDQMIEAMGIGAGRLLMAWSQSEQMAGVVAVGGNQGTTIAAIAMRNLPIGLPKLIVSTVASGNVRGYVGDSDITMMFSVGDLLGGPNPIIERILARAAGAIVGMADTQIETTPDTAKSIAITAFGNTHRGVVTAMGLLQAAGYNVVPFHASGACGSAMERLIEEGIFEGVLDLTTHELLGELYPEDVYAPIRPGRLTAAGRRGLPQVIVPGGLEYYCFGPTPTIPAHLRERPTHHHNPYNTNVRTSREELRRLGTLMAERLNAAHGPVAVLIPRHGWSEVGSPGGVLHDPEANAGLVEALRQSLNPNVELREVEATINDPAFATLAAETLLNFIGKAHGTQNSGKQKGAGAGRVAQAR